MPAMLKIAGIYQIKLSEGIIIISKIAPPRANKSAHRIQFEKTF